MVAVVFSGIGLEAYVKRSEKLAQIAAKKNNNNNNNIVTTDDGATAGNSPDIKSKEDAGSISSALSDNSTTRQRTTLVAPKH